MKYDVDYFIRKFEAIPEEMWQSFNYGDADIHCALGHCGMRAEIHDYFGEAKKLYNLISSNYNCGVIDINDGFHEMFTQLTPKQRILAALKDIKKLQQPEVKERIKTVYVSVPESIVNQSKELILQ